MSCANRPTPTWPRRSPRTATGFRAFVAVPLPSVGDALHAIERWADHDAFAGVGLLTNYAGRYLGDPAFEPVLAELDRREAVVHVHPQLPVHYPAAEIHLRPSLIEYVFDTTRAIVNLTLNGAHDRYPGITWIFSHCGGTAPYLAGRLAIAEPLPELEQVGEGGIHRALKAFHYDFALATTPYALGSALRAGRSGPLPGRFGLPLRRSAHGDGLPGARPPRSWAADLPDRHRQPIPPGSSRT